MSKPPADQAKPTVVLVHGAFAESASWNRVAARLLGDGCPVLAVANPLRGTQIDADYARAIPVAAHRFMAERAGARRIEEIEDASHVVGISRPQAVVEMIREAALATQPVAA
jgi:pimeloyl-ACP methyl ester carboxylesterase